MTRPTFDQIRQAHPIAEIVGQAVDLQKVGREYHGLCPFHGEKTPSFQVVPDKEFAHCQGCGWHGDVVDFVQEFQGVTTSEAIDMLMGADGTLEQSDDDKASRKRELAERDARLAVERETATQEARAIWEAATPADPNHPYLTRKGVGPHTCRQNDGSGLVLPVHSPQGTLQSIQTINDSGNKRFYPGAPMGLGRMLIGINMGRAILCEGFATGASIYNALPDQVCITFSLGNMEKVAREYHAAGKVFVLASDTGLAADKMASLAMELGVPLVVPTCTKGSDFNDMEAESGTEAVADAFKSALRAFAENEERRTKPPKQESGPVDLWSAPAVPSLPRGVLPPIIEQYSFECASQMGTDPAGFAMSALSCCAAMIGDDIKAQPKQHEKWTESARIWTMLIGLPSTRKSPMMSKTAGAIKRMDAELLAENNRALADWQADGGKNAGDKPLCPRLRIEDATTEAVQEVAKESPRGILVLQDEMSGFFGRIEKYGGKGGSADRSFWLQAYGGGQYAVNRVGRGAFLIDNLSVTMLGGIQPDPLIALTQASQDDGLIQRFIPITLQKAQRDRDVPVPPVAERFDDLLESLRDMKPRSNFFGPQPFQFSEDARNVREELADKHFKIVMAFEGINTKLSTHIGKYDGLYVRLCLLWHCIEHAGQEPPAEISGATAQRVAVFLSDFIMGHSFSFYIGLIGMADNHEIVSTLGGWILAHKVEQVTMASAIRNVRAFAKAPDWERDRAMDALEAFGWVDVEANRLGKTKWTVRPEVHSRFNEYAEQERVRRAEVVEIIKTEAEANLSENGASVKESGV